MADSPKLRWYSFRWRIVGFVLLVMFSPLIFTIIADIVWALRNSQR